MLRPHREPAARIAWITIVVAIPIVGILAYLLFGEVSIGRRRIERRKQALDSLPKLPAPTASDMGAITTGAYPSVFLTGKSINGFSPVSGNQAHLLPDSNATIDALVADIDQATEHVHLMFYIWLTDNNGTKVIEAVQRAARRGVTCRAMADSLGSRTLIQSPQWEAMHAAGVKLGVALQIGNPLIRPLVGRIDLRDHRKIVVIDGKITYCGSQNCADPEFRVKAKFAPWVDAVIRFEGPIAKQCQRLFAIDWIATTNEPLDDIFDQSGIPTSGGICAQAVGTGPTDRNSAMPELFETLIHAARRELVITTPYYVPDESLQRALCSAGYRGIKTTLILPARNDSWIVSGASRSYYNELLMAGVELFEYVGGLLHAKTLTIDSEVTLIGSANMDRRSFDLNYENNILFQDAEITQAVRERQADYQAQSQRVTPESVASWSIGRRFYNNTLALLAPVL